MCYWEGRNLQGGEEVQAQGQQQVAPQLGFPRALLRHLRPGHILQLHLQRPLFFSTVTGRLRPEQSMLYCLPLLVCLAAGRLVKGFLEGCQSVCSASPVSSD